MVKDVPILTFALTEPFMDQSILVKQHNQRSV
jgi:hypothetical protein